ncbi:MAG: PhnD/SsuA/transferrin family substrate-binding protein [Hydrogenophaga sp.]|nr:PhnD/SsuA/transferrin family substrate-binding protein [Hydrogenophaga sp.]MDP2220909.1 PhnD/SsuA/transferrin family substrate-binding protein [Hydrogenophaga sp.]MDZ4240338.1 PhnD/SsuA/transferrin family substrate-binding protein [Hydrogenophaga sp.]
MTKFKYGLFVVLGMALWGAVQGQTLAVQPPLRLSAIPIDKAEAMVRDFEPLATSLSRLIKRPVEFVYIDRHEKVLDALREGRIDLAVMGALPYVELVGEGTRPLPAGVIRPIARFKEADGQGTYRCVLVAFPDDGVVLARAQGLTLGMANRLSTCGPFSARSLLGAAGVDWARMRPHYLGHLTDVALAVVAGRVQLGAITEAVARQHASLGLQVLARTEPLPGFALVAHAQRVGADALALLARLPDTPAAEYSQWGATIRHGLLPVTDADYAPVRGLMKAQRP